MRSWILQGAERVAGTLRVPGDKSISHRALLLGALAEGTTEIRGFLASEDCRATLAALQALGVEAGSEPGGALRVVGRGPAALREPETVLDAGNSGTCLRLLAGVLAARPFLSVLSGDASLRQRPMRRIVEPLRAMGAALDGRAGGQYPPLVIRGRALQGISWESPVASAQVKSAILLAGVQAAGETSVAEPVLSRDHTERMLAAFGVGVRREGSRVALVGPAHLRATSVTVPGDISSAAFFLVAAAARPGGEVTLEGVGVNPTRSGLLEALRAMGARVEVLNRREEAGEPVADLQVRGTMLHAARILPPQVPGLIDEIPILAVAGALAEGETVIEGAAELRVKEVDRLAALSGELSKLGADIREEGDGLRIRGPRPLKGGRVSSRGDHRMAMSLAVAALFADGETEIQDIACVETSFPGFVERLRDVAPGCALQEIALR
jgi:3-phosphoshikimate 1-carboxyvinyltransferase